ncbi:DeoR/GlpR family DNA-binding transcription regulator [Paenibacillus marinisediminis]
MFAEERREKILKLLQQEHRVFVKDLAEKFQISIDSIRRDLNIMEEQGLLKKTHGGAIPAANVRSAPRPPSERYGDSSPQADAIAKAAVSYIHKHDTVFIGSSSTHYALLKHLPDKMPLTIMTNCMHVAEALREHEWIDTYLIGGRVKPSGNITDALASEFIRQFNIDLCFITGGGVSEQGISVATPEVAAFGRTVSSVSRRRIGLATHQVIGVNGFTRSGSIQELDLLITDEDADPDAIERIKAAGVSVIVAPM